MYLIIKFVENVFKYIRIKLKTIYWKAKYGKRIKIGKRLSFRKNLIINISKNGYLEIGDNCFFNNYCSINCHRKIIIGDNNIFGENVKLYDHNHVFNDKKMNIRKSYNDKEIIIGNDNWFASDVIVLSNCKLGNKNVVGCKVILNSDYDNNNVLKNQNDIEIQTINYKEA